MLLKIFNSRYHLGTAATGSVFMAICDAINTILRDNLMQRASENKDKTCVSLVLRCCCENLIYSIMYVSQSVYTMTAVYGTDFYTSGKNSFNLMMRNVEKIVVITQVRIQLDKHFSTDMCGNRWLMIPLFIAGFINYFYWWSNNCDRYSSGAGLFFTEQQ